MKFVGLLASAAVVVAAGPIRVHDRNTIPMPTAVDRRATSCTFTDAAAASTSKKSCSTIVLKGITVPAGTTLDMTGLKGGTQVSKPYLMIARALTDLRLSSREPLPLATLSGPDLYFQSPEPTSPSLAQLVMCSMAEGPDGGTERAAMAALRSRNSSTLTHSPLLPSLVST